MSQPSPRHRHLLEQIDQKEFDPTGIRVPLRIAGARLDLITRSPILARALKEYFALYGAGGPPVAELSLDPYHLPMQDPLHPQLWEDQDAEFGFYGDSVVQRDFAARRLNSVDWIPRAVALVGPESIDGLHNLLRWFLPPLLIERGSFLMHAGGVIQDGKGYVFFGASGAGKSTSTGLIRESDPSAALLGDDSVIIECTPGADLLLHSAPLGCGYSREAPPAWSGPLHGLFTIRHAQRHEIRDLTPSEGVAALLASAMNVRFDESLAERFELALRVACSRTGIHELRFERNSGFWPLVLAHARQDQHSIRRIDEQRPESP